MTVGQTYGNIVSGSMVEDVTDIIFQITPEDTPFLEMTGVTKADNVLHQWQTRSLTTRQSNKRVEGAVFPFSDGLRLPTRETNYTQIMYKEVRVSGSHRAASHYAISDLYADQMEAKMIELSTDAEFNFLRATLASGATTTTAREMQGFLAFVEDNATTFTDVAGGATMSEEHFNNFVQLAWDQGGAPKDVLLGGTLKRHVSGFTSSQTKFIAASDRRVVNTIGVYESDFFTLELHLSRDMPVNTNTGNDLAFVDRAMVDKAMLRGFESMRTPKVADSDDGVIIGEGTLEVGNPNAHVYVKQVLPAVIG